MKLARMFTRTLVLLLALFGVTAAFTAGILAWTLDGALTSENTSKGIALAESIANPSIQNVGDPEAIQSLLDRTMDMRLAGVKYLMVTDADGNIVAHTFAPAVPAFCRQLSASKKEATSQWLGVNKDEEYLDIGAPILAEQLGQVHIGMDANLIRHSIWSAVAKQTGLIAVLFLLGAIGAYVLMTQIAKPLMQLTRQAMRLAAEASPEQASHPELVAITTRRDEIGQLATAFQHMAQEVFARQTQMEAALSQAREATAAAEAANRAKNEFLSRMSHELRTPLNAILGFGQLLEIEDLTEEQRECVEQIGRGGKHLLGLINEVLDIARIEAGRMELSPEPVRVADAFQEVLELVEPLGAQRQIRFRVDLPAADTHCVLADYQKLKQVLLNLLSNAVKYNREQGEVRLACTEVAGNRLRLTVSDTGIGIPQEKLERLFMPFDRLGAEQTGVEGTGLGLALSKSLVDVMGGTLTVTSVPGVGSSFSIELARAEAATEKLANTENPSVPAPAGEQAHTLLYIEDNLDNLRLVQRILKHRPGIQLLTAMQGSLGMELARQHRPDLILLDVHLPDLNGSQVLRSLKELTETQRIPVVVVSADATVRQIERLRDAGASDYLTKPIDVPRFLEIIDEALKQPQAVLEGVSP
jgi:signal transduction histidine kinase/CheY-like chemotaxis protein